MTTQMKNWPSEDSFYTGDAHAIHNVSRQPEGHSLWSGQDLPLLKGNTCQMKHGRLKLKINDLTKTGSESPPQNTHPSPSPTHPGLCAPVLLSAHLSECSGCVDHPDQRCSPLWEEQPLRTNKQTQPETCCTKRVEQTQSFRVSFDLTKPNKSISG